MHAPAAPRRLCVRARAVYLLRFLRGDNRDLHGNDSHRSAISGFDGSHKRRGRPSEFLPVRQLALLRVLVKTAAASLAATTVNLRFHPKKASLDGLFRSCPKLACWLR